MSEKSEEYYTLKVAGLERKLKKFPVSDSLDIAAFILFGDVELTEACASALLEKVPEFDYIVTPEAKSIPLAYEMSKRSKKKYIVARKGVKVYMDRPVVYTERSITTQKEQSLYLGHEDGDLLTGKRVLILDDVISSGESLKAVQGIAKSYGADIVASCAVLTEGDAADRDDIIYLERLPLFFKD
ncbi:MAG: adenine phosphoribosyltransferase [Clostridiales bacterium]|nr:adenine phosphoribosyltransferase [Clostridiales bacterium]